MFITTMVLERTNSIATISPYSNNIALIIENEWIIEVYNKDKSLAIESNMASYKDRVNFEECF